MPYHPSNKPRAKLRKIKLIPKEHILVCGSILHQLCKIHDKIHNIMLWIDRSRQQKFLSIYTIIREEYTSFVATLDANIINKANSSNVLANVTRFKGNRTEEKLTRGTLVNFECGSSILFRYQLGVLTLLGFGFWSCLYFRAFPSDKNKAIVSKN